MKTSNGTIGNSTTVLPLSKVQRINQTRPFVRYSLLCETGFEVEHGQMLQSVLVHNSDTLKYMYCDVCVLY